MSLYMAPEVPEWFADLMEYDPCPDFEDVTGRSEQTNADDLADGLPGWEPWEADEPEPLDGYYEDDGD